jgi:ABC-type multidrug transport system fused ATPase/permease subunit
MLTKEEKRFIRYWEDQREDGQLSYFLQYTLVGGFIMSLFVFITLFFFLNFYVSVFILITVPVCCIIASSLLTHYSWVKSENRLKRIIKREVNQGKLTEDFDAQSK